MMKQLNKTENIIFLSGAVLMVIGSAANLFVQVWAPYVYTIGALAFSLMQFKQGYEGTNFTIRRLRNMMIMSDVFFLITAVMMFENMYNFLKLDYITYIKYVYNNWVVTLLVAAILQLYTTHRLSHELDKEAKKL